MIFSAYLCAQALRKLAAAETMRAGVRAIGVQTEDQPSPTTSRDNHVHPTAEAAVPAKPIVHGEGDLHAVRPSTAASYASVRDIWRNLDDTAHSWQHSSVELARPSQPVKDVAQQGLAVAGTKAKAAPRIKVRNYNVRDV